MKKDVLVKIILFIAILTLPTVTWGVKLFLADKAEIAAYYDNVEHTENRKLASWPKDCTLNEYTGAVESYYNDRVPYRSDIIAAEQVIDTRMENVYKDTLQAALIKLFYSDRAGDTQVLEVQMNEEEESSSAENVSEEVPADEPESVTDESHEYVEVSRVEPTCEEDGHITYECKDCGKTYDEPIPATGHDEALVDKTEGSYEGFGRSLYVCNVCGKKIWKDFEPKLIDTSYFPLEIKNGYAVMGRNKWLFYRGDVSLDYYTGVNVMDESEMAEHLKSMQKLKDICDEKGIELVYLLLPNKEIAYSEYMPTMDVVTEKRRSEVFTEYVKSNSDINIVYPLKELTDAKKYYDTYYPYDSHWNRFGAYVGTMELYDALGIEHDDVSQADVTIMPAEPATLGLVITGALPLGDYTDQLEYDVAYKPDVQITWEQGEEELAKGYTTIYRSKSDAAIDKKAVFIGDSFRIWMIPYLQRDFTELCAVQRENMEQAREDIQNADIIVLSAVDRFDKDMYARIPRIIEMLSQ